jgi:hypothetical protein
MSVTTVSRERPAAIVVPRPAGAKTFFTWVGLCLLGIPLAGYLGWFVGGHVDSLMPALIAGAITGAGIGFAQWLMLRRSLDVGVGWIVATGAALALGLAIGAAVVDYGTTLSQLAIMGAISGAFVGVVQGLLLRDTFSLWYVWIVAMPALWALGWVVANSIGVDVTNQFPVFGASGAVVFGILSGLLLIAGMRRDTSTSV